MEDEAPTLPNENPVHDVSTKPGEDGVPKMPSPDDDWWCFACERGFASADITRRNGKSWCQCDRPQQLAEGARVRDGSLRVITEEEVEHRIEATDELELNQKSQEAVKESGVEVVGTSRKLGKHDMLVVRGAFTNRAQEKGHLRKLEKALRRHNPNWEGVLLHLPSGMELKQLPAVMVESLYEALLARFDPDLFQMRQAKRQVAEEDAKAAEEQSHLATGEEVSRHLQALRRAEQAKVIQKVKDS